MSMTIINGITKIGSLLRTIVWWSFLKPNRLHQYNKNTIEYNYVHLMKKLRWIKFFKNNECDTALLKCFTVHSKQKTKLPKLSCWLRAIAFYKYLNTFQAFSVNDIVELVDQRLTHNISYRYIVFTNCCSQQNVRSSLKSGLKFNTG